MKTALVLAGVMLSVLLWAGPSTLAAATRPGPATRAKKSAVHSRTVVRQHNSSRVHNAGTHGRRGGRTRAVSSPSATRVQGEPTPDRYREIQGALASKGYLKSAPSGAWDADTEQAMRRYQADNQLEATGRINARSLIGLGLGGPSQDH